MPLPITAILPQPRDDKEFEDMVRDIFAAHWEDPNTQLHGRSGQSQNGVDIYGKPIGSDLWFGIQCKLKDKGVLKRSELEREIKEARTFRHKLDTYIFATTQSRDKEIQSIVEELNDQEVSSGSFKIQIRFWEDICSMLANYPRLIDKYYNQWGIPKTYAIEPLSDHPSEISENSPFLIGLLIDMSGPMERTIKELPKHSGISIGRIKETINLLVRRAVSVCQTPQGEEVASKMALFAYAYGFGNVFDIFIDIGVTTGFIRKKLLINHVQNDPVRDLFEVVAVQKSLPRTPNVSDLQIYWDEYKSGLWTHIPDANLGSSNLHKGLTSIHARFTEEMSKPYYKHPLLIIIGNGREDKTLDSDMIFLANEIKKLGVQILCCYFGKKRRTSSKELYVSELPSWPEEAKRLFSIASNVSPSDQVTYGIIDMIRQKGWSIPNNAKLFIQIDHKDMLTELVDIVTSPLRG